MPRQFTSLVLLTMIFLVSCSATKLPSNELVVLVELPALNSNPVFGIDAVSQKINRLIYRSLVVFDSELKIQGDLAQSWRNVANQKYVFEIVSKNVFHDQSEITAQAMVDCFNDYRNSHFYDYFFNKIASITISRKIAGPEQLTFNLNTPDPFFIEEIANFLIYKKNQNNFIGSGDFKIVEWANQEVVTIKRIKKTDNNRFFSQIIFKYIKDDTLRYQMFLAGEANVLFNSLSLSKEHFLETKYSERFNFFKRDGINFSILLFQTQDKILRNSVVRKAIALAINRQEIINNRFYDNAVFSNSIIKEVENNQTNFDPSLAQVLLDQQGYKKQANGFRFQLSFKTINDKYSIDFAKIIGEYLAAVAIKVEVQIHDYPTYLKILNQGDFQLSQTRINRVVNASSLTRFLHSNQIPGPQKIGLNRGHYQNVNLDQLLEKLNFTKNAEQRLAILKKIQAIIEREGPWVVLCKWRNNLIIPKTIKPGSLYSDASYFTLAKLQRF